MNKIQFYSLIFIFSLLVFSCQKDRDIIPQTENTATPSQTEYTGVFILNEGNFGWGNGSITSYNPLTNESFYSVYQSANTLPLGDVVQSMSIAGDTGYIVVNNSQKIEIVSLSNFKQLGTITGLTSPRYFLKVGNKGYVSDLYANAISIINLQNNTISGTIPITSWTEQLLLAGTDIFVVNTGRRHVIVIDSQTDQITDNIVVTLFPNSIVKDKNENIWALCSGGEKKEVAALYCIESASKKIIKTLLFPTLDNNPGNLSINGERSILYYLDKNVYSLAVTDSTLPKNALINANQELFYGLAIEPITNEIYVSDAIDYVQAGTVYRYSKDGNLIHQFKAGVIPGNFVFNN